MRARVEIRDGEALIGGRPGRPASPGLADHGANAHTAHSSRRGLYRASDEHDACGVGFVAHIKGRRSHAIVRDALTSSSTSSTAAPRLRPRHRRRRRHPGPDARPLPACRRWRSRCRRPAPTAPGWCSCPTTPTAQALLRGLVERIAAEEGQPVLGWRAVPTNLDAVGRERRRGGPGLRAGVRRPRRRRCDGPDADRALRARALRHPQAHRARRRRIRRCRRTPAARSTSSACRRGR